MAEAEVILTIDPNVYRLSAVKKAAYRMGDRCSALVDLLPEGGIRVRLTPRSVDVPPAALRGDFLNELLDQDLRESIAEETRGVRNLLLAQAFSGLAADDPAESADYRDDPLRIAHSQADNP